MNKLTELATRALASMYTQQAIAERSMSATHDGENMLTIFQKIVSDPRVEFTDKGEILMAGKNVGWIDLNRGMGWIDDKAYKTIPDLEINELDIEVVKINVLLHMYDIPVDIVTADALRDIESSDTIINQLNEIAAMDPERENETNDIISRIVSINRPDPTNLFNVPETTEKTYAVTIEEILSKTVYVRATNPTEAYDKVNDMYVNEEIVLYPEDCTDSNISTPVEVTYNPPEDYDPRNNPGDGNIDV